VLLKKISKIQFQKVKCESISPFLLSYSSNYDFLQFRPTLAAEISPELMNKKTKK